jgi:TetR/AcrR family transcriptional regulator, transcriptional repressor for nem operon
MSSVQFGDQSSLTPLILTPLIFFRKMNITRFERPFKLKLNNRSIEQFIMFNEKQQTAVEKATQLYWEKGFHATSMRHLQEVINMRPGSIYASFGSKEGLFKCTLQHYTHSNLAQIDALQRATGSPLETLKLLMQHSVLGTKKHSPSAVCMLAKTIAELTEDNDDLLDEAKQLFHLVEHKLEDIIAEAIALNEFKTQKDALSLARYLQIQLMGLRSFASTCDNEALIKQMIIDVWDSSPFANR